mmetsp:Transcript_5915/g.7810  ORF Transcript_5915/g.7810 Transcript_5915/m.7810 type:complete len:149 (+) Transcript_5915:1062-1508(+)
MQGSLLSEKPEENRNLRKKNCGRRITFKWIQIQDGKEGSSQRNQGLWTEFHLQKKHVKMITGNVLLIDKKHLQQLDHLSAPKCFVYGPPPPPKKKKKHTHTLKNSDFGDPISMQKTHILCNEAGIAIHTYVMIVSCHRLMYIKVTVFF